MGKRKLRSRVLAGALSASMVLSSLAFPVTAEDVQGQMAAVQETAATEAPAITEDATQNTDVIFDRGGAK